MDKKKIFKIFLYSFCVATFLAHTILAYAYGLSSYQANYTATLLSLSSEEKNNGYGRTRCSIYSDADEFTVSKGMDILKKYYYRYQVFSHYLVAGPHANSKKDKIELYCPEIDDASDALLLNTYNDYDYIYEIPLPLYKFYVDEKGEPAVNPNKSERPMFKDYGAEYTTYVSSAFADKMIEKYDKYSSYDDLIGSIYTIKITKNKSIQAITCSINNIYLSSDSEYWDLDTKKMYQEQFFNFPEEFGEFHKNGIFFASSKLFVDYGFWYEADVRTTYGNFDFYVKNVAKMPIVEEKQIKLEFFRKDKSNNHQWAEYRNFTTLLRQDEDKTNASLLVAAIVVGVLFLGSYLGIWLSFKDNTFLYYRYKRILPASPLLVFVLIQILFFIMFVFDKFTYFTINNFLGSFILLITIMQTVTIYLIFSILFEKGKKDENRSSKG